MRTLGDISVGRDNNLNLIRAIAATAVLVSHAYPIALGAGTQEPLQQLTGFTLGTLAVYAFFIISGFLITMSFVRTQDRGRFVAARATRLLPGLVVSILLVALPMGLWVSTLPAASYLGAPETWSFILRNIAMVKPQYVLPGVFETNPYPTVEGSIWTLIYEVACYGGVFLLGVLGLFGRRVAVSVVLLCYIAGWIVISQMGIKTIHQVDLFYKLSVPFALGTLAYLWQSRLPMSVWGIVVTSALCWLLRDTALYAVSLQIAMAYTLFWLAYVPGGWLRAYNHLGDYSYGIYIYAFPMQGLAVWLYGPHSPVMNMALALPLTVIPSVLSWHYVEKPCLDWHKSRGRSRLARSS